MTQFFGTSVIILDETGTKVLLGKRQNGYKPGFYGVPGGRCEVGEKLSTNASREIKEETNLEATKFEYLGVIKENQGEYDFLDFIFVCLKWQGQLETMEPEKCEGWEWFEFTNLPSPILNTHQRALDLYQQKGNFELEEL